MTNLPPARPLSRRERRLIEQQSAAAPTVAPAVSLPPLVNPGLSPEALYSLPHTNPVIPVSAPAPAPPPVQAPSRPLSRRELRQAQQTSQAGYVAPPAPLATPLYSLDSTQTAAPLPPLPPVFGSAPMTEPQPIAQAPTPQFPQYSAQPSVSQETYSAGGQVLSRTVGDALLATSSLILPSTPTVDLTSPLSSTGEVMLTGQIFLPPRFAETGTAPLLERGADQDEVMDSYATGEMAAMSKPMRASHAVSGKGDDTDILLVRRARWGKTAVVTALTAAALGLVAVGLLVLAMMTAVME